MHDISPQFGGCGRRLHNFRDSFKMPKHVIYTGMIDDRSCDRRDNIKMSTLLRVIQGL